MRISEENPLKTNRLTLRPFSIEDASMFYLLNQHPDVYRFTGDAPFQNIAEAKTFIKNYKYQEQGIGRWTVTLSDSHTPIGWCGLKRNEEGLIDLGFRILPEYWGKGSATEAAISCVKYGKTLFPNEDIIGRAHPENFASHRVLEKCGLRPYKTGVCGHHHDAIYFK